MPTIMEDIHVCKKFRQTDQFFVPMFKSAGKPLGMGEASTRATAGAARPVAPTIVS